jgi:hypothetical protein
VARVFLARLQLERLDAGDIDAYLRDEDAYLAACEDARLRADRDELEALLPLIEGVRDRLGALRTGVGNELARLAGARRQARGYQAPHAPAGTAFQSRT